MYLPKPTLENVHLTIQVGLALEAKSPDREKEHVEEVESFSKAWEILCKLNADLDSTEKYKGQLVLLLGDGKRLQLIDPETGIGDIEEYYNKFVSKN